MIQTIVRRVLPSALLIGSLGLATLCPGATPGTDSADQAAYSGSGWTSGANGGTGFKAWSLVSSGSAASGFFLGDSKNVASGAGGDINSNGKSFGMYGKGSGGSAEAFRSFDTLLAAGQTLSVDLAVNYRNGNKGFDLQDLDGKVIFNINVGSDDYVVNGAATGNGSIGADFNTNTVLKLSFTQTNDSGGTWTLTRGGGVSKVVNGTYTGIAAGLKFYVHDTDQAGSENDFYLNNLTITAGATAPAATGTSSNSAQ